MARYRAKLAYDGTAYYGFQRQKNVPTVQETVEQALTAILHQPMTIWAAGRTDAGVHATGQVIAFDAQWSHGDATLLRAVNTRLPDDVALQTITQQENFHPRFDALSRTYRYDLAVLDVRQPLLAKRAWQVVSTLEIQLLERTSALVIGEHDFAAFGTPPRGDNTIREIYRSQWRVMECKAGALLQYEVEATAFLYHMVRRLVGLQVAVARGLISYERFEAIFRSADLAQNKWMAPPQGLTLSGVRYAGDDPAP